MVSGDELPPLLTSVIIILPNLILSLYGASIPASHKSYGEYCRRRGDHRCLRCLRIADLKIAVFFEYVLFVILLGQLLFTRKYQRVERMFI